MKDEKIIFEKAQKLNLEIIDIKSTDTGRTKLFIHCKTHPYKPNRWVDRYNFVHRTQTCGCKLIAFTKEDLINNPNISKKVEIIGEYVNTKTKILTKCRDCGFEWNIAPNKLIRGDSCPVCNMRVIRKRYLKPQEQFIKELQESNPTLELVGEFNGMSNGVMYRCKICNRISYSTSAYRVLAQESGCHFCNGSIGENIIANTLEQYNIVYEREKMFEECKYQNYLYFDFYVPSYNLCIEMQGEQHYKPVDFTYTPTEESKEKAEKVYQLNVIRDNIKRQFCATHNISLLEISYKNKKKIPEILKEQLKL